MVYQSNIELVYLFVSASDSIASDTSADVYDIVWSAMEALTSLQALIKSSLLIENMIDDVEGAFFEVHARRKC